MSIVETARLVHGIQLSDLNSVGVHSRGFSQPPPLLPARLEYPIGNHPAVVQEGF